jgi:hypothetical protein
MQLVGEFDLSDVAKDSFDPKFELKVAVVHDGVALGSSLVKVDKSAEHAPFRVVFEPHIVPHAKLPCPVRVIVGPNVEDATLLAVGTVVSEVDLAPASPEGKQAAAQSELRLARFAVPAAVYARWLILCRKYTIHGRVVCRRWRFDPEHHRWTFCDAPVPGAVVQAFDVDRFLWLYWRTGIASAVTDINGNFTITFRWCCLDFFPWYRASPMVDPQLYGKILELFTRAGIKLPKSPPDPDPLFLQELATNLALAADQRQPLAAGPDVPLSAESFRALLPPSAELAAARLWPWFDWRDCTPDVVFEVTQVCGGEKRVIHSETNAETRWDIPANLNVTLFANDRACCLPVCRGPECPECIKLQWVGCTPTALIGDSVGPPDLRGYANVATGYDRPFFGALGIRGGVGWDVDYFKVQLSKDGGPWTDMPTPVFGGYSRSYWDGSTNVPVSFSPAVKNGQTVIVTRRQYETTHPAIPRFGGFVNWNDYDTLFVFDTYDGALHTARIPDGLYQLRFVGYNADAADNLVLSSERILPACGQQKAETVFIRLDNQSSAAHVVPGIPCTPIHQCIAEPDVYIRKICINEGKPNAHCITACEIVRLAATDTLTIHFTASVPTTVQDGHLGGYWMRAEYGLSNVFYIGTGVHGTFDPDPTFEVGPDYSAALTQGAPRPQWYGGDFKVTLTGADFPECCAYLLHLRAWKRTTNGCTDPQWVHANEFEFAFTVLRPELCPDICPDRERLLAT